MVLRTRIRLVVGVAILLITTQAPAQFYVEDFTTDTYKDAAATTADWNTGAGELALYPFTPGVVGSYATTGNAVDVEVEGNMAYLVDATNGLQILDITDPTSPALVGGIVPSSTATRIALDGDRAYLACGVDGLFVIDIADAATPTVIGSYNTTGSAQGVTVADGMAVVADGTSGIVVLDVSLPTPVLLSALDTPGYARGVSLSGNTLAVADDSGGLQIVNLYQPANPLLVGSHATGSYAREVVLDDGTAYVAASTAGLEIYSVFGSEGPEFLGAFDTLGGTYDLYVQHGTAFLADYAYGLQEVDVTDKTAPTLVRTVATPGSARAVARHGAHVMVADFGWGLQAVEVRRPTVPSPVDSIPYGDALRIVVDEDRFFAARAGQGFTLGQWSFESDNIWGGSSSPNPTDPIRDGAFTGSLLLVASEEGLESFDLSYPYDQYPSSLDFYPTNTGSAYCLDVEGNSAFLGGLTGLDVIFFNSNGLLFHQADYSMPSVVDLQVRDGFLYAALGNDTFVVINVSDPSNPVVTGGVVLPSGGNTVALHGSLALVTSEDGLLILDISDPTGPALVGSLATGDARDVTVAGNYALVAHYLSGLAVVDISNPAAPIAMGRIDPIDRVYAVNLAGDHVLVAHGTDGIQLCRAFQDEVYGMPNVVTSLSVAQPIDQVSTYRLTPSQVGDVDLEVTADGGATWQAVPFADYGFARPIAPGIDLRWRASLLWSPQGQPGVSDLELEWYSDHAIITAVSDVPDDQGGALRLDLIRSGNDFTEESGSPVTGYWIHQRVDDAELAARVDVAANSPETRAKAVEPALAAVGGLVELDDRRFLIGAESAATSMPPGIWEVIGSIPAQQTQTYRARVSTVVDSTATDPGWSVFVVTTHTTNPSVWYVSRPDSGYSVDNIAPGVPQGVAAAYTAGGVDLDWDDAMEEDFQFYRVYRSTQPLFEPGPQHLIGETATSAWTDPEADPWHLHYLVTVIDHAGNESAPGAPATVSDAGGDLPPATVLHGAVPNPFNPSTTIRFALAAPGRARLTVHDLAGRRVATLLDEYREAGPAGVVWAGMDEDGRGVSSGVYFCRLEADGRSQTKRMMLVR